jgi:hypothetical protein
MVAKMGDSGRKRMSGLQKEELLIDNFVGLQRAMTNLSMKFESLSDNLSTLLGVLELAARNYLTKGNSGDSGSPELVKQLNLIIDQNKAIAEGLLLIDDKIRKIQPSDNPSESSQKAVLSAKAQLRPLPKTI